MYTGLEALEKWRAKGSLAMREDYPMLFVKDVDKSCRFNPNTNYLTYPDNTSIVIDNISPWYCFTLIPKKTVDGTDALQTTLYMLQFLNWAIYYYRNLKETYDSIPKDPKDEYKSLVNDHIKLIAEIKSDITGDNISDDELMVYAQRAFKKNLFPIKPSEFLKYCRFFLRAWFEERFYGTDDTSIPLKFAHYASCYIEYCSATNAKRDYPEHPIWKDYHPEYSYNPHDENAKKEVSRLFKGKGDKIHIQYLGFNIKLEKYLNPDHKQKKYTYTISISQHGCTHTFYLFARLHQHRYKTAIK